MVCRITETYEQTSLHPRVNWRIAPFSLWMRASAGSPLKEGPIYSTQSPPAHRRCPQRDAGSLRVSLSAEKWLQCHAVRKAAQGVCLTMTEWRMSRPVSTTVEQLRALRRAFIIPSDWRLKTPTQHADRCLTIFYRLKRIRTDHRERRENSQQARQADYQHLRAAVNLTVWSQLNIQSRERIRKQDSGPKCWDVVYV